MENVEFTQEELDLDNAREFRFQVKKRRELLKAEERRRKNELREIRSRNRYFFNVDSEKRKKRTTTKILMYCILLNCTIVEVYSMIVMITQNDLSALTTLISVIIGESITYAIYCAKSHFDTKEEKQLDFDREVFKASQEEYQEPPDVADIPEEEV